MSNTILLISIATIIIAGIAIGYIFYGIINEDARFIIKYALLTVIICACVFIGCNYKTLIFKSLHCPSGFFELMNISPDKISRGNGVISVEKNSDGSVDILVTRKFYKEAKAEFSQIITKSIEEATGEDSLYSKIETNENFTEFSYYIYGNDVTALHEIVPEFQTLAAVIYNVVFTGKSNPYIKTSYYSTKTESLLLETSYSQ